MVDVKGYEGVVVVWLEVVDGEVGERWLCMLRNDNG